MFEDTICAVSTPMGAGGIAIVRMSGKSAISIADKMFSAKAKKPSSFESAKLVLGSLLIGKISDKCLCVVFRAPKSFTGEDIVEFQIHGGARLSVATLRECQRLGARLAEKGEFSRRAFFNSKASLDQLEGMIDMINAESDAALRAAHALSSGKLSQFTQKHQKKLTELLAGIEAGIDYPEEDLPEISYAETSSALTKMDAEISKLLESSQTGVFVKEGVSTLIVGKPNVGKSSILNHLVQKDRAIVTKVAGTTRDVIEDSFLIDGVRFNVIDTAGIRSASSGVEKIGVDKAKKLVKTADLVLFVVDSSKALTKEDMEVFDLVKNKNLIVVQNKSDKKRFEHNLGNDFVFTDALAGKGFDELKEKMKDKVNLSNIDFSQGLLTNERHIQALEKALKFIRKAKSEIKNKATLDIVAFNLKEAYRYLGEITGTTSSEEIVNAIFEKFCVGK